MSIEIENEKEWLHRIAQGDSAAFTFIFDRYQHKVFTFCYHILQSEVLAEEVVQEVMLKLWLQGYKAREIMHLDSWLKRVSRNRAIDLLRQQKSDQQRLDVLGTESKEEYLNFTEEHFLLQDARRLLEKGIQALPEQQRKVYEMIEKEDCTAEDVSKSLGLHVSTVHTHLKLARKFLRKFLSNYIELSIILILLKLF